MFTPRSLLGWATENTCTGHNFSSAVVDKQKLSSGVNFLQVWKLHGYKIIKKFHFNEITVMFTSLLTLRFVEIKYIYGFAWKLHHLHFANFVYTKDFIVLKFLILTNALTYVGWRAKLGDIHKRHTWMATVKTSSVCLTLILSAAMCPTDQH